MLLYMHWASSLTVNSWGRFTIVVVVVCCVSSITVRNSQFLGNLSYLPLLLLLIFDRRKVFPVSRRSYHYLTP